MKRRFLIEVDPDEIPLNKRTSFISGDVAQFFAEHGVAAKVENLTIRSEVQFSKNHHVQSESYYEEPVPVPLPEGTWKVRHPRR